MCDRALCLLSQLLVFRNLFKKNLIYVSQQTYERGLRVTLTLQTKKRKLRGVHEVLEFKDHALSCPRDVVHDPPHPRSRTSFVFPKHLVCVYFMDTEFCDEASLLTELLECFEASVNLLQAAFGWQGLRAG